MSLELDPGDVVLIYSDGVTDAQSARRERCHSAENSRLRGRLSLSGDRPKAIGHEIIRDLQEFSAGRSQFDDITLICFGPVGSGGCQSDSAESLGMTPPGGQGEAQAGAALTAARREGQATGPVGDDRFHIIIKQGRLSILDEPVRCVGQNPMWSLANYALSGIGQETYI